MRFHGIAVLGGVFLVLLRAALSGRQRHGGDDIRSWLDALRLHRISPAAVRIDPIRGGDQRRVLTAHEVIARRTVDRPRLLLTALGSGVSRPLRHRECRHRPMSPESGRPHGACGLARHGADRTDLLRATPMRSGAWGLVALLQRPLARVAGRDKKESGTADARRHTRMGHRPPHQRSSSGLPGWDTGTARRCSSPRTGGDRRAVYAASPPCLPGAFAGHRRREKPTVGCTQYSPRWLAGQPLLGQPRHMPFVTLTHLMHRTSRFRSDDDNATEAGALQPCWLTRISVGICEAPGVDREGFNRASAPALT